MSAWPQAVWITKKINTTLEEALHFKEWLELHGDNKTIVDEVASSSNFTPKNVTEYSSDSVWLVVREKGV